MTYMKYKEIKIVMSGQAAQRGFIFQTVIALIECLEKDDWAAIKIEPKTELEKVDIMLFCNDIPIRAIQVKSSQNEFKKEKVRKWLEELKADAEGVPESFLYLVGDKYSQECRSFLEATSEIKAFPFSELETIYIGKLSKYIKKIGLGEDTSVATLFSISENLFGRFHRNSIDDDRLTRSSFKTFFDLLIQRCTGKTINFYNKNVESIEASSVGSPYGDIPLVEAYIEPTISYWRHAQNIQNYLKPEKKYRPLKNFFLPG